MQIKKRTLSTNREERKCFFLVIAGLLFREKKETVWRPKEM